MNYAVGLVAIQNLLLSAATIPFQGSVAGTIEILSPGPVIENRATGATTLTPFGVGDYVKHGFMDFGALNPDGSGTGTGTFTIDFGAGNSFAGTYIETAFPPSPAGTVVFSHVYTISGGTGIFAGASGTASHPPALTSLDNLAFSFVLSGVVSAPLLQPVPEPSTLLAGIAAIAFVLLRCVDVRGKLAVSRAHNALGFGTGSVRPIWRVVMAVVVPFQIAASDLDIATLLDEKSTERVTHRPSEQDKDSGGQYDDALALYSAGRFAEAERAYVRLVEALEHADTPDRIASALNNLGVLYARQARLAEAETAHRRAMEVYANVRIQDPALMATLAVNLGEVFRLQARWHEAESIYRRALRIVDGIPSRSQGVRATVLNNLGLLYLNQNKPGKAEPMLSTAVELLGVLSPSEPETYIRALTNLASAHGAQGRDADAYRVYDKALETARRHFGPAHKEIAPILNNLACIHFDRGEYETAEELLRDAMKLYVEAFGPGHALVGGVLGNLASVSFKQKQYERSEQLYKDALAILTKTYGYEHPETARAMRDYAGVVRKLGRRKEAVAMERRADSFLRRHVGNTDATVDIRDLRISR